MGALVMNGRGAQDWSLLQGRSRGFESLCAHRVVSRVIPDGCLKTSRTRLGMLTGSFLGLVLLGGVDPELGEEFAFLGDDAYVAVGGEDQDAGSGVAAPDAEVAEH